MSAGKFDKFVAIQENNETTSDYNEKIDNWENVTSVWCSIDAPSAKEINQNKDIQLTSVVITMWPTTVTNVNRIKYGTEIYDIQAVMPEVDMKIKIHAVRNHDRTS